MFVPPYVWRSSSTQTQVIPPEMYFKALAENIRARRGKQLKDQPLIEVVQDIFRQQSARWDTFARGYESACFSAVCEFVRLAVVHVAGSHTAGRLFEHHIDPALDTKGDRLSEKVSDILWPYRASHPITYHGQLDSRTAEDNESSWAHKARRDREDLLPAAQALDQAEAYYDVSTYPRTQ